MSKCKLYSGISQESIEKALNELSSQNLIIDGRPQFLEMNDKFILYYKEKPKTQPTLSDMQQISPQAYPSDDLPPQNYPQEKASFVDFIKQNTYIVVLVIAIAVGYFFFVR